MTNSFSERHGIIKPASLNPKELSVELKNRLWNITKSHIDGLHSRNIVIVQLWDRFFKGDVDTLRQWSDGFGNSGYFIDQIKEKFYISEWNRIYDFLEFLLSIESGRWDDNEKKEPFIESLNLVFIDEGAQYKIIDDLVTPLISGEEAEEVEKAVECEYQPVSGHIKKALELYRKRPTADYENSIKESIHAIEALARIVLNEPSATLGNLAEKINVHPAFQKAIKILYGWTSDQGGIRHAEKGQELKIDEKEARYMLVQCSALVNYIISKY